MNAIEIKVQYVWTFFFVRARTKRGTGREGAPTTTTTHVDKKGPCVKCMTTETQQEKDKRCIQISNLFAKCIHQKYRGKNTESKHQ